MTVLAVHDRVSGAPGLAGGLPHAVVAPVVDLGGARIGVVSATSACAPLGSRSFMPLLSVVIRTADTPSGPFREAAAVTLRGQNIDRASTPVTLDRFVSVWVRPLRSGADFQNVRVALEAQ